MDFIIIQSCMNLAPEPTIKCQECGFLKSKEKNAKGNT